MKRSQLIGCLILLLAAYQQFGGGVIGGSAPFQTDKLSVLIVEETAQRGSLTADQRAAILATAPGSLIATVKERGGEYRVIDKDQTNFALDAPWVAKAFAVDRKSVPWIVTAGPSRGVSEPLPATTAEILKAVESAK